MAPPKRRRVDDGEESEMTSSIKEMVKNQEAMVKSQMEMTKNQEEMAKTQMEMSKKLEERINQLEEKLPRDDEKTKNTEKEFVMKHTFEKVLDLADGSELYQPSQEHFGRGWFTYIRRNGEYLAFFVATEKPDAPGEWIIKTEQELELIVGRDVTSRKCFGRLVNEGRAYGSSKFLPWDEMKRSHLIDGALTVQARVKILKMEGIVKPKAFHFDESNQKYSDIVVKVGNEKFYVGKDFLTHQSAYFTRMFEAAFKEGNSKEVELKETDAQDFQNFLEVLYGDAEPDDFTVEGILLINDKCHIKTVIKECSQFLMNKSEKTVRKKLELASRYHLDTLADQCVSKVNSAEYKAMVADGFVEQLSYKYVSDALIKRSVTFF